MATDLVSQLQSLVKKRDLKQKPHTLRNRLNILKMMGRQLIALGFEDLDILSVASEHVQALITRWQTEELSPATIRNRLSVLRWWAAHVGKTSIMPASNEALGISQKRAPARSAKPQRSPTVPHQQSEKFCHTCFKLKPLEEFARHRHMLDGRDNKCLACNRQASSLYDLTHRAQKHAYDAAHKRERRLRDLARKTALPPTDPLLLDLMQHTPKRHLSPMRPLPEACVYFVQLDTHRDIFKIGQSRTFSTRLPTLQQKYGLLHIILLIPYAKPARLERIIHQHFIDMRIYEGLSSSELFRFDTKRKRQFLERFLAGFSACTVTPLLWNTPQDLSRNDPNSTQANLFSFGDG